MLRMTLKRLLFAVPSLIGVVIVTFLLTRALPGDPAAYFAGPAATQEAVEQIDLQCGVIGWDERKRFANQRQPRQRAHCDKNRYHKHRRRADQHGHPGNGSASAAELRQ